jgi:hypothetical protein
MVNNHLAALLTWRDENLSPSLFSSVALASWDFHWFALSRRLTTYVNNVVT